MAKIISFSDISTHFRQSVDGLEDRYCLADTNFIVACLHQEHKFNSVSRLFFKDASSLNFRFFVTHTSRTEFLDIERKISLTKPLISLYEGEGQWKGKISKESKKEMVDAVNRVQNSNDRLDFFSDKELKNIKSNFPAYNESGKVGWIYFCHEFLNKKLEKAWDDICKLIGLNYLNLREEEVNIGRKDSLISKKLDWSEMVSIVGKTAMGTADSMIANAFLCSKIDLLVTTDLDIAYGLCADLNDCKFVAIPDKMFDKHKVLFQKINRKRK